MCPRPLFRRAGAELRQSRTRPRNRRKRGDSGRRADRSVAAFAFEIAFSARKSDSAIACSVALSDEEHASKQAVLQRGYLDKIGAL